MYTINLKKVKQDSINFHPYSSRHAWEAEHGRWFNFQETLERSIRQGDASSEEEIRCFCDGSNNVEPYFTSNSPEEEAALLVEETEGLEFDPAQHEYDCFKWE